VGPEQRDHSKSCSIRNNIRDQSCGKEVRKGRGAAALEREVGGNTREGASLGSLLYI
jgi:hypothetical protein